MDDLFTIDNKEFIIIKSLLIDNEIVIEVREIDTNKLHHIFVNEFSFKNHNDNL
jgi:hypothetical protein